MSTATSVPESPAPSRPSGQRPRRRAAITWRSVLTGSLAVAATCALQPFNDYVVSNNFLIGSYLPVALVLFFFVLIVFVNAPLHRWAPQWALSSGELATIMLMMLVSSSVPSQGLMRSFLPALVGPFYQGYANPPYWDVFRSFNLPQWLFPASLEDGRGSPVVSWFYGQTPTGRDSPYTAWIVPIAGWGLFFASLWTVLVSAGALLREQWEKRERLPFPLAELQLQLVESPAPGHALNELFRSRLFWIAVAAVVCLQSTRALNVYVPKYVPAIATRYDFTTEFTEGWLKYLPAVLKSNQIYFMFIGVMYFVPGRVGFSVWSIYLALMGIGAVRMGTTGMETPVTVWQNQHLGAAVAWLCAMLWIGREYWRTVIRHMFVGRRPTEHENYRGLAWASVLGLAGMLTWLTVVGVGPLMAVIIVATTLLAHLVVARIVAETGMPVVRTSIGPANLYTLLPYSFISTRDAFFAGTFSMVGGAVTTRESVGAYAMHGLRVTERAADADAEPRPARWKLMMLIAWSMLLALVVSSGASLYNYYRYTTPLTTAVADPVNNSVALINWTRDYQMNAAMEHARRSYPPPAIDARLHLAIGAIGMTLLLLGSSRFGWWPLAPVAYLVATSNYMTWIFSSCVIGWAAKALVLRLGGISLYRAARPVFIGLICGEALATGIWICVNLVLVQLGRDYGLIRFMFM